MTLIHLATLYDTLQYKVLLMSTEMFKPQSQLLANQGSPYWKNGVVSPTLFNQHNFLTRKSSCIFHKLIFFFHRLVKTSFLKLGYAVTLVHLTRSDCLFLTKFFPTVKRYFKCHIPKQCQ